MNARALSRTEAEPALLQVDQLDVHFKVAGEGWLARPRWLHAIDSVSFSVHRGETLGVVGESGCGKSTLSRALMRLIPSTAGSIQLAGEELTRLHGSALRAMRRHLQLIFQDPLASLDPRQTVGEIIEEPLRALQPELGATQRRDKVLAMMQRVGLLAEQINRYAHEFSGGQAQRIGIARALVVEPSLVICDEPVSALDVSIKSQVINLLDDLQAERGLTYIFIAHDLAAMRHIADRVMVLYLGRVMELADRDSLYRRPRHPYTRMLLSAVPLPDPRLARQRPLQVVQGELPSPLAPPSGCVFRTRCPYAIERCARETPWPRPVGGSQVACHRAEELPALADGSG